MINSRSGLHITVFYHRAQTWWLSDNGWHFRIDIHWLNWLYGTVKKNLPLTQWSCETVRKRTVSNAMLQMTVQIFSVETSIKFSIIYLISFLHLFQFRVNNSLFLLQFNWMTPVDMSPSTSARTGRNCTIVCLSCPHVTPTDDRRT